MTTMDHVLLFNLLWRENITHMFYRPTHTHTTKHYTYYVPYRSDDDKYTEDYL
jgi:hypothetical protein